MAVTTFYVSEGGTAGGAGTLGDPMILGGASFTAMLAAETFAANAVRIAFLPGTHAMAAAITPAGTPTLDNTFECVAVDAAGNLLADPAVKYGPVSDFVAAETNAATRATINLTSAALASKANVRFRGLNFNVDWAASATVFDFGNYCIIEKCRFNVLQSLTNGTPRTLISVGNDSVISRCPIVFAAAATTFATTVFANGGGIDVDQCYIQGAATSGGSGNRHGIQHNGVGARPTVSECVINRIAGNGLDLSGASSSQTVLDTVVANIGGAGINLGTIPTAAIALGRNHITGCGGWGIAVTASSVGIDIIGPNRMRNNTSGNIQTANMGDRQPFTDPITTAGSDATDFVNATAGDFRLATSNPAYGLGVGAGDVGGGGGDGRFPRFSR